MAPPAEFTRRLFALARNVELNSGEVIRDAVAAALVTLVRVTPVGGPPTSPRDPHPGLARSNWQVLPGEGSAGAVVPVLSESETIARGLAAARVVPIDGAVTISNPLPYIDRLNAGSSAQAPANFVELALFASGAAAQRVRLLTGRR